MKYRTSIGLAGILSVVGACSDQPVAGTPGTSGGGNPSSSSTSSAAQSTTGGPLTSGSMSGTSVTAASTGSGTGGAATAGVTSGAGGDPSGGGAGGSSVVTGAGGNGSGESAGTGSGGAASGAGGNAGGGGSSGTGGAASGSGGAGGNSGASGSTGAGGSAVDGGATGGKAGGGGGRGGGGQPVVDAGGSDAGAFTVPTVTWPSAACQTRTAGLLAMMTRNEKAAQMVMAGTAAAPTVAEVRDLAPGAVLAPGGYVPPGGSGAAAWANITDSLINAASQSRLGIPILYGLDAVHGHNGATGTVIFPHNIGLGSTRNPALVQEVARITALEVAATGITWTFAPVLSVSWDDRWGRVYESFSEDPDLTQLLGAAAAMGLQGARGLGTGQPGIVGCSKHWAGDGQATAGTSSKGGVVDRGDIRVDLTTMRRYGIGPYLGAIKAGLGSVMVSDARWNGACLTSHRQMMTDILKTEIGFKGFISTDWNAATDCGGGVVNSVNAGVDMLMQPSDWKGTITTIANSNISDARLNDAVTRILNVKCEAGLFGWRRDPALLAQVGSAAHRAVGRRAVRESLVLMQNNNAALPIAKTARVWVGGSGANSMANQCGGWTISWQGSGNLTQGTTIAQAIGKVVTPAANMTASDVAVVVLSEPPYAEFSGDRQSIDTLPPGDFTLLSQARAAGKKVVAIILSGRPTLITSGLANADAWIAAWLPGTEGDGVADVLFGDYAPTGKLSHSWPRSQDQANVNIGQPGYNPLFQLGHGLTY